VTRAAHQDIDGLAETLEQRAEIEGLAKGVRIGARRQIVRWALRWGLAVGIALVTTQAIGAFRWIPVLVSGFALLSLLSIFLIRARANRSVAAARAGMTGGEVTLSEAGRTPRKDRL